MTEEEWTNRDIDAAVMLRLGARGATSETILLAVDQPTLTPEQLHSSLRRLEQVTGRISWYPDTGRVVAAAILTTSSPARPTPRGMPRSSEHGEPGTPGEARDCRGSGHLGQRRP